MYEKVLWRTDMPRLEYYLVITSRKRKLRVIRPQSTCNRMLVGSKAHTAQPASSCPSNTSLLQHPPKSHHDDSDTQDARLPHDDQTRRRFHIQLPPRATTSCCCCCCCCFPPFNPPSQSLNLPLPFLLTALNSKRLLSS